MVMFCTGAVVFDIVTCQNILGFGEYIVKISLLHFVLLYLVFLCSSHPVLG